MPKAVLSYLTRVKLKSSSPASLTALLSVKDIQKQTDILYCAWQENEAAAFLCFLVENLMIRYFFSEIWGENPPL